MIIGIRQMTEEVRDKWPFIWKYEGKQSVSIWCPLGLPADFSVLSFFFSNTFVKGLPGIAFEYIV